MFRPIGTNIQTQIQTDTKTDIVGSRDACTSKNSQDIKSINKRWDIWYSMESKGRRNNIDSKHSKGGKDDQDRRDDRDSQNWRITQTAGGARLVRKYQQYDK